MVIHNTSAHPYSHKLAASHSFIHRLNSIPLLDSDFQKELNIIKQIAVNNGYQSSLIDQLLNKKLYLQTLRLVYPIPTHKEKFHILNYIGTVSDKIGKYFTQKHANIAFRTKSSLGRYIKNNKSKVEKLQKSGVYELLCGSCDKIYICLLYTSRCV